MKKQTAGLLLFLCTEQFTDTTLFTSLLLFWTCIIDYYMCVRLCAHILYFNAAKFSIKQFSVIYLTVSVVRQRDEYEIVTEIH